MPILRRELTLSARRGRVQIDRAWFAGIVLVIVLGTFISWYYALKGAWSADMMSAVATQSFLFVVIAHAMSIFMLSTIGALSIAGEVDRKTLGFLLATRLGNAEIVLGKLAACMIGFLSSLAAGLPVMILLNVLGGVHPPVDLARLCRNPLDRVLHPLVGALGLERRPGWPPRDTASRCSPSSLG